MSICGGNLGISPYLQQSEALIRYYLLRQGEAAVWSQMAIEPEEFRALKPNALVRLGRSVFRDVRCPLPVATQYECPLHKSLGISNHSFPAGPR